jgi:V/A-type H+-transporting ATPase subunit A
VPNRRKFRLYSVFRPTLQSWSRYLDQLQGYFAANLGPEWTDQVKATQQLLADGDSINQMMQVTGEEGITLQDFVRLQKSLFVDMVYLQQDGFDATDASVPIERQKASFEMLQRIINRDFHFKDKEQVHSFFTRLTGLFKNLNYAQWQSEEYDSLVRQIDELEPTRRSPEAQPVVESSHAGS